MPPRRPGVVAFWRVDRAPIPEAVEDELMTEMAGWVILAVSALIPVWLARVLLGVALAGLTSPTRAPYEDIHGVRRNDHLAPSTAAKTQPSV
jgi:hypothetical protein